MADKNFVVKNGLTVNNAFTANSTQITLTPNLTINTTSFIFANANSYFSIGGNFVVNTSQITAGNQTLNIQKIGAVYGVNISDANAPTNILGYLNISSNLAVGSISNFYGNILIGSDSSTIKATISSATGVYNTVGGYNVKGNVVIDSNINIIANNAILNSVNSIAITSNSVNSNNIISSNVFANIITSNNTNSVIITSNSINSNNVVTSNLFSNVISSNTIISLATPPYGDTSNTVMNTLFANNYLLRNDVVQLFSNSQIITLLNNLGIINSIITPGTINYFASQNAPSGWLKANGSQISRTAYNNLFSNVTIPVSGNLTSNSANVLVSSITNISVGMPLSGTGIPSNTSVASINATSNTITLSNNATSNGTNVPITVAPFGVGDGSTTFTIPDLRGVFARGLDNGRGLDISRTFGSYQVDMYASHTHNTNDGGQLWANYYGGSNSKAGNANGAYYFNLYPFAIYASGGSETVPKNVSLLPCIKY